MIIKKQTIRLLALALFITLPIQGFLTIRELWNNRKTQITIASAALATAGFFAWKIYFSQKHHIPTAKHEKETKSKIKPANTNTVTCTPSPTPLPPLNPKISSPTFATLNVTQQSTHIPKNLETSLIPLTKSLREIPTTYPLPNQTKAETEITIRFVHYQSGYQKHYISCVTTLFNPHKNNEKIGHISFDINGPTAQEATLETIKIQDQYQSCGFGSYLMMLLQRILAYLQCKKLNIFAWASGRKDKEPNQAQEDLRNFYKQFGAIALDQRSWANCMICRYPFLTNEQQSLPSAYAQLKELYGAIPNAYVVEKEKTMVGEITHTSKWEDTAITIGFPIPHSDVVNVRHILRQKNKTLRAPAIK